MNFEFHLLDTITNKFSEDNKVGSGSYGDVYKGVYNGKEIAVKKLKLDPFIGIDDTQFHNEFRNLSKVEHQNVVQLLGYCYESRHKYVQFEGEPYPVFTKSMERLLCFEYMQGGSLEKHITDESCDLDWTKCYQIIKGTCEGLNHLHSVHEKPIFHLDLKPANILLDNNMTPKIADLGLSRLVASTQTHRTEKINGTQGYMPPEYVDGGAITRKFDVFSLGVIILKLLDGNQGLNVLNEMGAEQFIEHVCENWKKRLQAESGNSSNQMDTLRVKTCVEIATRCAVKERNERPFINDIVQKLEKLEAEIKEMSLPSVQSKNQIGQSPWLKRPTGARRKMLPSRSLQIANNEAQHWRWISHPDSSRLAECAELLSVYFLAIAGEIPPKDLSAGTSYVVYLVYKLTTSTSGLKGSVQTSSLRLYGERTVPGTTCKVSLDPEARGSASDVTYPVARDDGWLELRLAEFANDDEMLQEKGVIVDLREENCSVQKIGLIVAGMEFRSN